MCREARIRLHEIQHAAYCVKGSLHWLELLWYELLLCNYCIACMRNDCFVGLAIQRDAIDTIEVMITRAVSRAAANCETQSHLFQALLKTKLIPDTHSCNYSRAGRTDKGVSALGQVCTPSCSTKHECAIKWGGAGHLTTRALCGLRRRWDGARATGPKG